MTKNVQLLLLKTVDNLGIVGDVVRVKPGYARNFLLPHGLAVVPTPARIESLKEDRAKAEAEMAAMRHVRQQLIGRLENVTIAVERSCNDQGALYGSVTQRDISDALCEAGYGVDVKSVRLAHPIRRVGTYSVLIQFDRDLKAEISIEVKPDRELEMEAPEPEAEAPPETRPLPRGPDVTDIGIEEEEEEEKPRRGRKRAARAASARA
jgi:large subunit ribosomal protein L9